MRRILMALVVLTVLSFPPSAPSSPSVSPVSRQWPIAGASLGPFRHGTLVVKDQKGSLEIAPAGAKEVLTHPGVDLVAACGTAITAVSDGVVVDAVTSSSDRAFEGGLGFMVLVKETSTAAGSRPTYDLYLHLETAPSVEVGRTVVAGKTVLGAVGHSGNASSCHTHLEVRHFGTRFLEDKGWRFPWNIYGGGDQAQSSLFRDNWSDPLLTIKPPLAKETPGLVGDVWLLNDGKLAFHPLLQWQGGGCRSLSGGLQEVLRDDMGAKRPEEWRPDGKPNPSGPRVSRAISGSPLKEGMKLSLAAGNSEAAAIPSSEVSTGSVVTGVGPSHHWSVVALLSLLKEPKLDGAIVATKDLKLLKAEAVSDPARLNELRTLALAALPKEFPSVQQGGDAPFAGRPVRISGELMLKAVQIQSSIGTLFVTNLKQVPLTAPPGGKAFAFQLLVARLRQGGGPLERLWSAEGLWWEMAKLEIGNGSVAPMLWGAIELGPGAGAGLLLSHPFTGGALPRWEFLRIDTNGKAFDSLNGGCSDLTGSGG